jgi:flagellar FliJ protein
MKKKRSARLSVVLDLEVRKKKEADKFLANQVKKVESDKLQLQQLENYLNEYQEQYKVDCKNGISIAHLTSYQAFMNKISTVIEQHKAAMKYNQEQLVGVRMYWSKVHARHNAVDGLIEKIKIKEQQVEDKSLQKMIDEISQLNLSKKSPLF